jgi:hypothetical protein
MADHVMQENSLAFNPRAIAGKAEIVRILEAAL